MRSDGDEYNSNAFRQGEDSLPDIPQVPENPRASALVVQVKDLVFRLGETLGAFQRAWPKAAPMASPPDPLGTSQLRVQHWLGRIAENVDSGDFSDSDGLIAKLVINLCQGASRLRWRQTYTSADVSEAFLANYGYTEIVGSTAAAHSDRLAAGFLLLGPHTFYPRHQHEAEEIYVPLSGTAEWLQGDGVWRSRRPGTIIHHAAYESHAMRTGVEPLLALYLWLSDNLKQRALLE